MMEGRVFNDLDDIVKYKCSKFNRKKQTFDSKIEGKLYLLFLFYYKVFYSLKNQDLSCYYYNF